MRKVIVTGGSRGIGAAVVSRFAENGDKVAFIYKSSDEAADKLTSAYHNVYAVKADLSSADIAAEAISDSCVLLGGADVLVNNAGVSDSKLICDVTENDFYSMISANLGSAYFCSKAVIPFFLRGHKGRIINISSMWGEVGASMETHYSASKAGLIGFTKALAKELAPSGITVNCVSPGLIDTDMNACYDNETIKTFIEEIPLGRIGTPEDIACAVFFFASDDASFITGQVLGVNGGYII